MGKFKVSKRLKTWMENNFKNFKIFYKQICVQ